MFDALSYERFKELASSYQRIAIYKEIPGDRLTPSNAYLALDDGKKNITLLESSPKEKHLGRYSFLCFEPQVIIQAQGKQITISHNNETQVVKGDAFNILREYHTRLKAGLDHPLSGFVGGLVGFMSYDAIRHIEKIPDRHSNNEQVPELLFRSYGSNIVFDHQTGKVVISTVADTQGDLQKSFNTAMEKIEQITQRLFSAPANEALPPNTELDSSPTIKTDIDDQCFKQLVEKAKQYIVEGDIFQVVLSRQFKVETAASAFDIYRALRFNNPSPYMFYLETPNYVVAGASPEKLISLKDGVIESCPLAGTRPRSSQTNIDDAIAAELLQDSKEVAEHMMLVDLARNDLGAVATSGTVAVTKLKEIEKYSRVMHISSTVRAKLAQGKDVFDALKASFPAGTLSGAPKIRAMEIIDELEHSRRGIYGGVICGIDSHGNLDSCIAIRTAFIQDGVASVRAGAGVVYNSDPQGEANETRDKAQAILEGILLAQESAHDFAY